MLLKGKSWAVASPGQSPHQNHPLDALPAKDYKRVASHLYLIPLRLGAELLKDEFGRFGPATHLLRCRTEALITQTA